MIADEGDLYQSYGFAPANFSDQKLTTIDSGMLEKH